MNRGRLVTLLVLVVLAAGTRWLLLRDQARERELLPEARADYSLDDFELTVMNPAGTPRFVVAAPRLDRNPEDGSALVREPMVEMYDDGQPGWHLDAATGWISDSGEEVRLAGDVRMVSLEPEPVTIVTQALTVFPDRDRLESAEHVLITGPRGRLEGVGLEADLGTRAWRLLSAVRARLLPSRPTRE